MKKITKALSVTIILCILMYSFSGCQFFKKESVSFSQDSIAMVYGETLDLGQYINIKNSDRGVYTLTATPANGVVSVITHSGIKAVGIGNAVIKVTLTSGSWDTINITVRYTEATTLTIFESGNLYQQLQSTSHVTFAGVFNEGADPSVGLNWFVNSQPQSIAGGQFTLPAQSEAGEYTVRAEHKNNPSIFDQKIVRVYKDYVQPEFVYNDSEIFDSPQAVEFSFNAPKTEGNPEYLFELYVNGHLEQSIHSYNPVFEYNPVSAGIYTFTFKVNGTTISNGQNEDSVRICFKGVVTPHGLNLDFASDYPSVYLNWLNREQTVFTVLLVRQDGKEDYITNISAEAGHIDIGTYIDLTKNYTIKVKSENHGEYFLGSEYVSFQHEGIPSSAITYLNSSYLNGNHYMSNDQEVLDFFDYMLIFRPDAKQNETKITSECSIYMGYTSSMSATVFAKQFEYRLTITGNYWWSVLGNTSKGNIIKISIIFYSKNQPENFNTAGKQAFNVLIHPKLSSGYSRQLPVDSFPVSASTVTNTNELFYTLEKGLRPTVTAGSAAERIYTSARNVLKNILDDSMSDAEIARAIYDWIIFKISYDNQVVTATSIDYAVLQPAYYPEGVFDTGFAVCDGISKSFSLLSNMMGIKCVRVVGTAGKDRLEHAWNKIMIGGGWYIVDATWGGGTIEIDSRIYKTGTHEFFLLSDADTATSHFEAGPLYPKSAPTGYNWFIKNNQYVYDTIDIKTQMEALASLIAQGKDDYEFTVMGKTYNADYSVFEFKIASTLTNEFSSSHNSLTRALQDKGLSQNAYEYFIINSTTVIVAVK